jgi:tetratricopeptide (TPR) repeat protein
MVERETSAYAQGWQNIQTSLRSLIARVKENKVVDVAIEKGLEEIPILGGFLSALWGKLEGPAKTPDELVRVLDMLAQSREAFDAAAAMSQQNQADLERLLFSAHGRLADLLDSALRQETGLRAVNEKLERMAKGLNAPEVRDALNAVATLADTAELRAKLMKDADDLLAASKIEPTADAYDALGFALTARDMKELAEAAFLRAHDSDPAHGLVGLSIVYHRRAQSLVREENFGLAEKLMARAQTFVESAARRGIADVLLLVQWGMTLKELAQSYSLRNIPAKMEPIAAQSEKYFRMALALDPNDANAYDGLGSLLTIRGDLLGALELFEKAVALEPRQLFSHFNLAQVQRVLAQREADRAKAFERVKKGAESLTTAIELVQSGADTIDAGFLVQEGNFYKELFAQLAEP